MMVAVKRTEQRAESEEQPDAGCCHIGLWQEVELHLAINCCRSSV